MTTFWMLWIFNALVALVPVYFFFVGLNDGSITSKNIGLWFLILAVVALVIGGTLYLKSNNQIGFAKGVLMVAAIPGLLALIFMIIVMVGKPRWN
jgi:drug/metabolite transporter (DMT)-like permease